MLSDDLRLQCLIFPMGDKVKVLLPGGRQVPRQFTAMIDRPELNFSLGIYVEPDGSGVCTGISCFSKVDGERPWISDVIANLPEMGLRAWVRYAIAVAIKAEEEPDVLQWPELPTDLDEESPAREFWREIAEAQHQQPTRRRKVTTLERLREVAATYNAAIAQGRHDPTVAVGEAMNLSRSQAAKLVSQCRDTTPPLLPPTGRKRKGGKA